MKYSNSCMKIYVSLDNEKCPQESNNFLNLWYTIKF